MDFGGDVFGHQLGTSEPQIFRGLIEPVGENAEKLPKQLDRQLVLFAKDFEKIAAANGDELAFAIGMNGGAARRASDESHFSEMLAGAEGGEPYVSTRNPHLAGEHDEELIAAIAFFDDPIAVGVGANFGNLHHPKKLSLGQPREERHLGEDIAFESELLSPLRVGDRALAESHHNGGDVVFPTRLVGEGNEALDRRVSVLLRQVTRKLVRIVDVAVKAVGGEQELIAGQ